MWVVSEVRSSHLPSRCVSRLMAAWSTRRHGHALVGPLDFTDQLREVAPRVTDRYGAHGARLRQTFCQNERAVVDRQRAGQHSLLCGSFGAPETRGSADRFW